LTTTYHEEEIVMKRLPALLGTAVPAAALLLLLVALLLAVPVAGAEDPPPALNSALDSSDYQLLVNPGVEVYDPPYAQFDGKDCQVASGWQRFWDGDLPEPCWMDCRVFAAGGWVERIEGDTSQLLVSTEPYDAGIRQTVSGLAPGVGYGFHAAMLTIYQSSAPPDVDGTMIKQVGLDPAGGTDPGAPTVVWSEPDDNDEGPWAVDLRTSAFAQGPAMTVFIRVVSPHPAGDLPYVNLGFLDSAILARTPVVTATSPEVSETPAFTVRWDNVVPAPGLKRLKWRDVQWLDESENVWHDWLTETYDEAATFAGDWGHTYRFRARVCQKYENGALLCGPFRPDGDTRTAVGGPRLAGRVFSSDGLPLLGATVLVSGTPYSTTTGLGGRYDLPVLAWSTPQTVTVSHPRWLSPDPAYGVSFGPTSTVTLTWTLRPLADAVTNGGFEAGLTGWSSPGAATVTGPVHTGHQALALPAASPDRDGAGASQTLVLTAAWEPVLSFWYRASAAEPDDLSFNVALTVVTRTLTPTLPATRTLGAATPLTGPVTVTTTYLFTPSLEAGGWQHQWYPVGPPGVALSATVTVRFLGRGEDDEAAAVYVDEVSLGATWNTHHRLYLPLVGRRD
jgi:hypothetical protein